MDDKEKKDFPESREDRNYFMEIGTENNDQQFFLFASFICQRSS